MRASPAVLSMLPYTEKFDEEKSKCASLVTELDLAKHTCTVWGDLRKAQQRCAPAQKTVINMM
jgi:hypothetical protein